MSTNVNKKYQFVDEIDAIIKKDWAAGSKRVGEFDELVFDGTTFVKEKLRYPPALMKMFDEAIVNVLDQVQRTANEKNNDMTKNIEVTFENGVFTIFNDGKSIEIEVHSDATKLLKRNREIYVPEFIFGVLHQGSNKADDEKLTTGGINGLGAKICNCFSTEFIVEIQNNKKNYIQKWTNNMRIVGAPTITKVTTVKQFVKLSFRPDYKLFDYEDYKTINKWLTMRLIHANIFAKYVNKKVQITFNGTPIKVSKFEDMYEGYNLTVNGKQFHTLVVMNSNITTANINGIIVKKGSHIKFIKEAIKAKLPKSIDGKTATKQFGLMINCIIPQPRWGGQRKDELVGYSFEGYELNKTQLQKVVCELKKVVTNVPEKIKKVPTKRIDYSKYDPARKAGTKEAYKCRLLAAEGDSAMAHLKKGLSETLGMEYFGLISLGGVIMNVRKVADLKNGKYYPTKKIVENNFISSLLQVTGLDFNCDYSNENDIKKLKYGGIIACVDQDVDGIGQIFGLLLNLFEVFWPNLLKKNYIQRFELPLIFAYPKKGGQVEHFYSQVEYERWATDPKVNVNNYNVKYCKGLGSHSVKEMIYAFKNMDKALYKYTLSESDLFEACYGKESNKRKEYLGTALIPKPIELLKKQQQTKLIYTDDHLTYETKEFQKDNIGRHLISAIDGFNESGRMIFDAAVKKFSHKNDWVKTAQFAGFVAEHENYHHGEGSLEKSITLKAFLEVGGVQLPLLLPNGNFGNRRLGPDGAAAARYTTVKLNKKLTSLLFPQDDYYLLEFNFDEGKRSEPKFFVPIIPTAILEHLESPATGWKIKVWGRDVFDVIENVRNRVKDKSYKFKPMKDYLRGWNGEIKYHNNMKYSYGKYKTDRKKVLITELPLKVWIDPYRDNISKKNEKLGLITSESADDKGGKLKIVYTLADGAFDYICKNYGDENDDAFIDFFNLKIRMDDHLNMIGEHKEVIEFAKYEDIIECWFPIRYKLYEKRIERQKAILKMKISYYENVIKFCNDNQDLTGMSIEKMKTHLHESKYKKFNHTKLMNPEFMQVEDILKLDEVDATYDYILNMKIVDRSTNSVKKYEEKLQKYKDELEYLSQENIVEKTWLNELDELEKIITYGFDTNWEYEEFGKFKL